MIGIQQLYESFHSPRPIHLAGCPCCTEYLPLQRLVQQDLEKIEWEDLRAYVVKAMTTVGTRDDFRYFLPRILHLLLEEPIGWPDLQVILNKLVYAQYRTWPDVEVQTLIDFFEMGLRQLADVAFLDWLETLSDHLQSEGCSNLLKDWLKTEAMQDLIAFRCQNLTTNHDLNN